jgi:hypothetical protein
VIDIHNSPRSRATRSVVIAASIAALVAVLLLWHRQPAVLLLVVSAVVLIVVFLAVVLFQAIYLARELRVQPDALTAVYGAGRERRISWSEVRSITISAVFEANVEFVTRRRNVLFYNLGVRHRDWYSLVSLLIDLARENHIPLYMDIPLSDYNQD